MSQKEINFNLPRNIKTSISSVIINIFLAFITYRLVISFHGIELVGVWSILVAVSSLVNIANLGMGVAIIRYVSSMNLKLEKAKARIFIETGIIFNFIWHGILTFIAFFIINYFLRDLVPSEFYIQALAALPILMFSNFMSSMTFTLISSLQSIHKGFIGFNISILGAVIEIILALIFIPKIGIFGFALSQAIRYLMSLILCWIYLNSCMDHRSFVPTKFSFETFKIMFGYSIKVQASGILNALFEPFTKLTLSQYGDIKAQGFFELAYKTVSLTRNIVVAGLLASIPALTNLFNSSLNEAKKFYLKAQFKLFTYLTTILILVALVSPLISIVWIGNLSHEYILLVIIFVIGYWVITIAANAYNLGFASGIMKYNLICSFMLLFNFFVIFLFLKNLELSASLVIALSANISLIISGIYIKTCNEKKILNNKYDSYGI